MDFVQKWWKFCYPRRLDFRRLSSFCLGIQKVVVTGEIESGEFLLLMFCCVVLTISEMPNTNINQEPASLAPESTSRPSPRKKIKTFENVGQETVSKNSHVKFLW